jgi:hypothetical protein
MVQQQTNEVAIKAAKKNLKRQGSMELKELAKSVSSKVDDVTEKDVQKMIKKHKKFQVDENKVVTLIKRKRSVSPQDLPEELEKATKISKSCKVAAGEDISAEEWRKTNKIVLIQNGETTTPSAPQQQDDPWTTFPDCESSSSALHPALIRQCVEAPNNFVRPSPIQAQSWPIIVRRRDMVGIAETGTTVSHVTQGLFS